MSSREPFTVSIYEAEATLISNWTLRYPTIETGGDLFGLWESESNIVVQLVLGPGKKCRRTHTSFFQDKDYLSHVGGSLTTREGLCNVGAWHSHHRLNLPGPSNGDAETIWRNLPTPGRFLLLIASIETGLDGNPKVGMTFSLFDSGGEKKKMLKMKCKILEGNSPLRAKPTIERMLWAEAEDEATKQERRNDGDSSSERKTCEGGGSHSHSSYYTLERHRRSRRKIVLTTADGTELHIPICFPQNSNNSTSRRHPTTNDRHRHKGNVFIVDAVYPPQNPSNSINRYDSYDQGCCVIL